MYSVTISPQEDINRVQNSNRNEKCLRGGCICQGHINVWFINTRSFWEGILWEDTWQIGPFSDRSMNTYIGLCSRNHACIKGNRQGTTRMHFGSIFMAQTERQLTSFRLGTRFFPKIRWEQWSGNFSTVHVYLYIYGFMRTMKFF